MALSCILTYVEERSLVRLVAIIRQVSKGLYPRRRFFRDMWKQSVNLFCSCDVSLYFSYVLSSNNANNVESVEYPRWLWLWRWLCNIVDCKSSRFLGTKHGYTAQALKFSMCLCRLKLFKTTLHLWYNFYLRVHEFYYRIPFPKLFYRLLSHRCFRFPPQSVALSGWFSNWWPLLRINLQTCPTTSSYGPLNRCFCSLALVLKKKWEGINNALLEVFN